MAQDPSSQNPSSRSALIQPPATHARRRSSRGRLLTASAVLIALVAGSLLIFRSIAPDRSADDSRPGGVVELAGAIGRWEQNDDTVVRLRLEPGRTGENTISARTTDRAGTPVPPPGGAPLSMELTSIENEGAPLRLEGTVTGDGAVEASEVPLPHNGWWRAEVSVGPTADRRPPTPFYVLLPDPNANGAAAVDVSAVSPEAAAFFERGLASMTSLHRVRFRQSMADGMGNVAVSVQSVNDGSDGQPPTYRYQTPAGFQAYVFGGWRWMRTGDEPWTVDGSTPMIPPSEWGEEYAGATGFRLGRVEEIDGEACQIVTFVVPETTTPRRQKAAWFAWWVGTESGQVRREAMVSSKHYMLNDFSDFDAPMLLLPPPVLDGVEERAAPPTTP